MFAHKHWLHIWRTEQLLTHENFWCVKHFWQLLAEISYTKGMDELLYRQKFGITLQSIFHTIIQKLFHLSLTFHASKTALVKSYLTSNVTWPKQSTRKRRSCVYSVFWRFFHSCVMELGHHCFRFGAKPSPQAKLTICQLRLNVWIIIEMHCKMPSVNVGHLRRGYEGGTKSRKRSFQALVRKISKKGRYLRVSACLITMYTGNALRGWGWCLRACILKSDLSSFKMMRLNRLWPDPCSTQGSKDFATWAPSQYKDRLTRYGIPILKIRQSRDRLIFNMGIHILVRGHLYIETAPCPRRLCDICGRIAKKCLTW